jgi:outer membrane protein
MSDIQIETAAHRLGTLIQYRYRGVACLAGAHRLKIFVVALAASMLIVARSASAQSVGNADASSIQESGERPEYGTAAKPAAGAGGGDWNGFVGLAGVARPLYDGSSESTVSPFPLLHVTWRNRIELGPEGLSVLFSNAPSLRFGAGLTFDPGRDERDGRAIFSNGDAERFLRGLGDVKARPGLRLFGVTGLGPVMLRASVAKYFADDDPLVPQNDGVLGDIGATLPLMRTERLRLAARVDASIADESFMQAFFGVTPTQSTRSGYAIYTPNAGFKDITFSLHGQWTLSQRWFVAGDAGVTRLVGDAADSPLVRNKAGPLLSIGFGYRF